MADNNKMDLGDVAWPKFFVKSADGTKDRLEFKVWGGRLRIAIVKEGEFKAFFERPLDQKKLVLVKREMQRLMKASPETKHPIVFSSWDPETKKASTDWVFVALKDGKQVYSIEIHNGGQIYKFSLKGPFGVSLGSDPMSEGDKSEVEMQALLDFLTMEAPISAMLSNKKRAPGSFSRGGSSGGGGKSSNSSMDTEDDSYF